MKLLLLLTVTAFLQASGRGFSQSITISLKNAELEQVFKEISRQTNYNFIYTRSQLENSRPVTIEAKNLSLTRVLDLCFANQDLDYLIQDSYIVIKTKATTDTGIAKLNVSGRVINDKGEPVEGISVTVKKNNKTVFTDSNGEFNITGADGKDTLLISGAEVHKMEVPVKNRQFILITILSRVSQLDETIIMAYGTTTTRMGTGNIQKISGEEISRQPVTNLLNTIEGRVTGLVSTQNSGLPGAPVKVEIRGRTSINPAVSNDPLFVIDGVPFGPGNSPVNTLTSALGLKENGGGLSPLNIISPSDIESIEILKDADATAIYGSRGANGVILITTKKGKPGRSRFTTNITRGSSRITRQPRMLTTKEYLELRKEGFANDGIIPTAVNAPDLFIFDSTAYTDFKKYFIGGRAGTFSLQSALSGGSLFTQYLIGVNYHHETTVFPGDMSYRRGGVHFNLNHSSNDKRFTVSLSGSSSFDRNNLISSDLSYLNLPPNYPGFFDENGELRQEYKGYTLSNPMGFIFQTYEARGASYRGNLQLTYKLGKSFTLRNSLGYNETRLKENKIAPKRSLSILNNPSDPYTELSNGSYASWIIEPQLLYHRTLQKHSFDALLGATWQSNRNDGMRIYASGFISDAVMGSVQGAGFVSADNSFSEYRYQAFFSRLTYTYDKKIILNLAGRTDGSSRFGEEKRFDKFGSAAAAWIFSKEKFFSRIKAISFGKIRSSYGITGNDKIGDYQYLNRWQTSNNSYQGNTGLYPLALLNPDYRWEENRKWEVAMDLGLFKDRLLIAAAMYWNRSGNQLINYSLPVQTGFSSVLANFPALVLNKGTEITITSHNTDKKNLQWKTFFNISFPKNKLLAFPGIENSSYSQLTIGEPIGMIKAYRVSGIDALTGVYSFEDQNGDGVINAQDRVNIGHTDAIWHGGLRNSLQLKGFQFDILFSFRKQMGRNYMMGINAPGMYGNKPYYVLDRWQQAKQGSIQRATASVSSPAYAAYTMVTQGTGADIAYEDASFVRLKNIYLSYSIPEALLKKLNSQQVKFHLEAQNLVTITGYKGADPETQSFSTLPPLRTIVMGVQIIF